MLRPRIPKHEKERLASLEELNILDTHLEEAYDQITKLAAEICDVPICLISLIDGNRQWFKSRYGLEASETPRDYAFCAHAINEEGLFEVNNALEDERFHDNPLVVGAPNVIFYTGAVLKTLDNMELGTLCVIDNQPRELNEFQKRALQTLADQVVSQLELRRHIQRLDQANNLIKRESEKRMLFFSSIGHEIRTPLNGIVGLLELFDTSNLNQDQLETIETAKNCSEDLITIVNDILSISRLESGEFQLEKKVFDIRETVDQVINVFKGESNKKGIDLNYSFCEDCYPIVIGDSIRIKQIFSNIIANAVKFTKEGSVTVKISSHELNTHQLIYEVDVIDTGIGIAENEKHLILEDFYTRKNYKGHVYSGAGLGLGICSKLLSLMNGNLSFESVEGEGAVFSFSFQVDKHL